MQRDSDIDGLVLAGGKARRFSGLDKGLQTFRGEAMVEHVIRAIAPAVDSLLISCNRNLPAYQRILGNDGYNPRGKLRQCVADADTALGGPLAGIHTAIQHCTASRVFVCPCDMPLIASAMIDSLANTLDRNKPAAAYAVGAGRAQYLLLMLDRAAATASLEQLSREAPAASRSTSVQGWLNTLGAVSIELNNDPSCFANVNDLEQLKSLEKITK